MSNVHSNSRGRYLQPALIVWSLYLLLTPIYVFKNGLPQPGDLIMLILIPIALRGWNGKLPVGAIRTVRLLFWFTLWVCIVNYAWAIALGKFGLFGTDTFALYPLYYVYNSALVLVALVLYERHREIFLRVTLVSVQLSLAMQIVGSFTGQTGGRGALFFNNPNQLGYYALLAACLLVLLHWRLKLRMIPTGVALMACGYLAMLSASRAAIGGIAVLLALTVFTNPRIVIVASAVAISLLFVGGPVTDAFVAAQDRIENRTHHLSFLEERGYSRITEHSELLVFGAGEGGLSRFAENPLQQMEIHSSIGTVIFSYGVVGIVLFIAFLLSLLRGSRLRLAVVLVPPLIYTVAHQGLRFSMMWVLFAIFLSIKTTAPTPQRSFAT